MEWWQIVVSLIGALGGFELIKWLFNRFLPKKTEQRLDESEAGKSEVEVQQAVQDLKDSINETWQKNIKEFTEIDTARIKELRDANTILNNQITDLLKAGARKDEIISDKTSKIRELEDEKVAMIREYEDRITSLEKEHKNDILALQKEYEEKITELTRQLGHQEKLAMFYRTWHCEREYGRGKENCLRRKPAQDPPLKYCPPELVITELRETDPLILPKDCVECNSTTAKSKSK